MRAREMIIKLGQMASYELRFEIEKNPIADLWVERMDQRHQWSMDNPDRFYGFDSLSKERQRAHDYIWRCIDTINGHDPVISRPIDDLADQDTLNYLHHIFETYHGQLDRQDNAYWRAAPESVRQALRNLNLAVHRCESLSERCHPMFICTWFGMPKTKTLPMDLKVQFHATGSEFGGVYLTYAEIGKTAEDMANDNDQYMADEMFQPFNHYSADFRVDFYTDSLDTIEKRRCKVSKYFEKNRDFFQKFDITSANDIRIKPIKFKVAQLIYESSNKNCILSQIRQNQYVSSVMLK